MPSFSEYVLVRQDSQQRTLKRPGQWLSTQFTEGELLLESLDTRLELAEIDRDVRLPE